MKKDWAVSTIQYQKLWLYQYIDDFMNPLTFSLNVYYSMFFISFNRVITILNQKTQNKK